MSHDAKIKYLELLLARAKSKIDFMAFDLDDPVALELSNEIQEVLFGTSFNFSNAFDMPKSWLPLVGTIKETSPGVRHINVILKGGAKYKNIIVLKDRTILSNVLFNPETAVIIQNAEEQDSLPTFE
jgi:hypothetical protein